MKVTYLEHSGFVVEYKDYVLIFDWYKGEVPEFDSSKKIYVFSSHSHYDHFNPLIFTWRNRYHNIKYILSADIKTDAGDAEVLYVIANKKYQMEELKIQTLQSTDEGVAYVVCADDKVIYHAGDLNWWHWEEETEVYNNDMQIAYQKEIDKLKDTAVDVAFVPLDPRQEDQYYWGMDYFMKHVDTKIVFPMHMWEQYDVYERLMKNAEADSYKERVVKITGPGETFELTD